MLSTLEYIEVVEELTTQASFGKHTLHSVANHLVHTVGAFAKLFGSVEALTAGITSVAGVNFVGFLLAGEYHLGCIDDDHIVTTVHVRSKAGLVLTADQLGNL